MKKFFVSTGLAAISAAGLQSVSAQGLDIASPKSWSISGTLRGFYDDNYDISGTKKGSWGAEVSPSISVNIPLAQTDFGMRYYYGLYYYNDRDSIHVNPFDQSHQFEVWLDHAFNTAWKLNATDHFAIGQEPELLQPDPLGGQASPIRHNGNNISNHAHISLDTQWSTHFSTSLSYGNEYFDYDNSGASVAPGGFIVLGATGLSPSTPGGFGFQSFNGASGASLSGLLDRVEQSVGLDGNWTFNPETVLSAGYGYGMVNYIGNEPVAIFNYIDTDFNPRNFVYHSRDRDSRSHNGHVGINRQLTANISLAISAGVSFTDSYNDPIVHTTSISPNATASLSYTYTPGSYIQLGVSHGQSATDQVRPAADGSITQYQHFTTVYGDINHRFSEKLIGTLIGRFSYSSFEGGEAASGNATPDYDYNVGLNFTYQFSRHFSADGGYNFDDLISGLTGRGYVRNRVYLGLTASY